MSSLETCGECPAVVAGECGQSRFDRISHLAAALLLPNEIAEINQVQCNRVPGYCDRVEATQQALRA